MPHFHHTVSGTSLPAEQTDQYIEDGGGMAPGARDLDVEAGSQSPAADTSLPEARAEDPPPGVPQDATAAPPRAGRGGTPVVVPMPFLALVLFTGALAVLWAVDFFIFVGPELEAHLRRAESSGDSSRVHRDRQDRHVYYTNVLCFFLFVTVRGLMQLKPVWRRLQAARSGLLGPARRCASVAVVNGPLCLFTVSSVMLWTEEFFRAPRSAEEASDIQLSRTLRMFSLYSLLVALLCCVVLLWNGLIRADAVIEATRASKRLDRRAPPGFISRITTVPYDPELFGTEDGRQYHGECPICLGEFGAADEIKVPLCGHAFHKDCLARWLRKERTCALCRQDVTQAPEAGAEGAGLGATAAGRGVGVPEETAALGAATPAHPGAAGVQAAVLGRSSSADGAAASNPTHDAEI